PAARSESDDCRIRAVVHRGRTALRARCLCRRRCRGRRRTNPWASGALSGLRLQAPECIMIKCAAAVVLTIVALGCARESKDSAKMLSTETPNNFGADLA